MEKDLITHSRMTTFRACRRLHYYQYFLGVRPRQESMPMKIGTAFHAWLEEWLRAGCRWPSIDPAVGIDDAFEAARLRAMALAYHIRWSGVPMRVIAVEEEFRVPLVNPDTGRTSLGYEKGGKIDAYVAIEFVDGDDGSDDEWIVEHKTTAVDLSPGSTYWMRKRADPQISIYMDGAITLGRNPRGVLYDVISKPDREPLKATPEAARKYTQGVGCPLCRGKQGKQGTGKVGAVDELGIPTGETTTCNQCRGTGWKDAPHLYANQRDRDETPGEYGMRCFAAMAEKPEYYLQRVPVHRLDEEMTDHRRDLWSDVKVMHECRVAKRHTRNPDACFSFNRRCDFYDVCWSGASIDDPEKFRRLDDRHPELVSPKAKVHLPVVDDGTF